ncbi:MAG: methylisocitrate lyase [Nitrospira sp.]|nr:methylisocitrate lyase [Nitrospira sp.]MCP9474154.1 methylisocitrate lyase [Nitrospira sp.]
MMGGAGHSPGTKLREAIDRGTVVLPGAFNALTALQIEQAGFQALYVSGAGLAAARGLPDLGLLSMAEVIADAAAIARAVSIPAIVDVDTGFGPPLAVMRTVEECERAGLAGIQIEDQELPKRCGHLPGKRLVSLDEMTSKIHAACHARHDPALVIIARTDARAVEGLEGAVTRARAYVEAGADVIFPEALESAEEFRRFADQLAKEGSTVPLLANMTEFGRTPYLSVAEFESLGYRVVLFPVTALRVAAKAVELLLAELKRQGSQRHLVEQMQTRHELYDLLRYEDYEQWSRFCEAKEEGHADH